MTGFINALPGAVSQGLIWGIMAIGVYITYKILDIADLTVDGSFCTGGAVFAVLFSGGVSLPAALLAAVLAGMAAGLVTGLLHTLCGIPAILAGILTQLSLWSINMAIMSMRASVAISITNPEVLEKLLVSLRFVQDVAKGTRPFYRHPIFVVGLFTVVLIALLYWFFGTELGCSLRATGSNERMSRAQGINTDFNKVLGLMVSNGMVALSGALLAQYNGANEINVGRGGHRYRPCRGHHRRCAAGEGVPQFRAEAGQRVHWRYYLLHRHAGGAGHGPEPQLPQGALRAGGGGVPVHSLLEGQIFPCFCEGRRGRCLRRGGGIDRR